MANRQVERKQLSRNDKKVILSIIDDIKTVHAESSSGIFHIDTIYDRVREVFAEQYANHSQSLQALCTNEVIKAIHENGVPGVTGVDLFSDAFVGSGDSELPSAQQASKTRLISDVTPEERLSAIQRRLESEESARRQQVLMSKRRQELFADFQRVTESYNSLPEKIESSSDSSSIHLWLDEAARTAQGLHDFPDMVKLQEQLQQKRKTIAEKFPEDPLSIDFLMYHSTVPLVSMSAIASYSFSSNAPDNVEAPVVDHRKLPRPGKRDATQVLNIADSIYKRGRGLANSLGELCGRIDIQHQTVGYTGTPHEVTLGNDEEVLSLDDEINTSLSNLTNLIAQRRLKRPYVEDLSKAVGVAFVNRDFRGNDRLFVRNLSDRGLEIASVILNALCSKDNNGERGRRLTRGGGNKQARRQGPPGGSSHVHTEIGVDAIDSLAGTSAAGSATP